MVLSIILSIRDCLTSALKGFEKRFPTIVPYIWGILSACMGTMQSFFVKKLSPDFATPQILFFRSLELALFTYGFMRMEKLQFHYNSCIINRLLIARALAGTAGVGLMFYGLRFLPLSDATVIGQVYPVMTGVLATLVLGEKYEKSQLIAAIVCIIGLIMIAQPPAIFGTDKVSKSNDGQSRMLGTFILLLGGLSAASVEVLIKKVGSKTNMGVTTLGFGVLASMIGSILSIWNGFAAVQWHHVSHLFWLGLLSFLGQILKNRAFYLGNAGRISNTSYSGIVVSFLLDIFVLGNSVNYWSIMGGMCILSCMFIYIYQLYVKEKRALMETTNIKA